MLAVHEATAEAIRRAYEDGGEFAGALELRRHFPLIGDNSHARLRVRAIVGWKPLAAPKLPRRSVTKPDGPGRR
jgi:hypothetical protein